jgi:hypothetical protein
MSDKANASGISFFQKGGKGMLFLICVLLASIIWVVNALSKTYITEINYSLTAPLASGKDDIPVKVKLSGQGFDLIYIYLRINKNKYPFSTFNTSVNCIEFTDSLLGDLRKSISLMDVKPALITGSVTANQKMKRLPVKSKIETHFASRYGSSVSLLVNPDSVDIAGPASVLDSLRYIETESLRISNLDQSLFRSVGLITPHPSCWLQKDRIWIYIPAEEYTEAIVQVPVTHPDTRQKTRLIPERVSVICLVPVSRYKSISPSQFKVEIKGSREISKEKVALTITKQPGYVKNVRTEPRIVSILLFDK